MQPWRADGAMKTYQRRKEQGICPRCKQPADNGHTYCKECREQFRSYQSRNMDKQLERLGERYRRLRTEGKCVICQAPSGGMCMCLKHRKIYNERRAKRRHEKKDSMRDGGDNSGHREMP